MYEFKNLRKVKLSNGRVGISFFYNEKRYRFFNGKIIDSNINPNTCEKSLQENQLEELYNVFYEKLSKGWRPKKERKEKLIRTYNIKLLDALKLAYDQKIMLDYSDRYKKDLTYTYNKTKLFITHFKYQNLPLKDFDSIIIKEMLNYISKSKRVQLNLKRNLGALLSEIFIKHKIINPFNQVKLLKQEEVLHKPIKEIKEVLEDIKLFNTNLHLCCLLAYGCLLRPHREIRNLKWSNFSEDCSYISLSGAQNKGKKNRIVPVPIFVQSHLKKGFESNNIFSNTEQPFNEDYFKTLWSKYKKRSKILKKEHTLYSFRHTGAINVFEKSGSLVKLQQVMGHSNLNVSLTYLRGLEIKQLNIEDMPNL
jgi:integrase